MRKFCEICKINLATTSGKSGEKIYYKKLCSSCHKKKFNMKTSRQRHGKNHKYKQYRKDYCEICSFIAIKPCQLDVDHIDNNRENNDPKNLQTLCSNCHRLKTYLQLWGEEGELEDFYNRKFL